MTISKEFLGFSRRGDGFYDLGESKTLGLGGVIVLVHHVPGFVEGEALLQSPCECECDGWREREREIRLGICFRKWCFGGDEGKEGTKGFFLFLHSIELKDPSVAMERNNQKNSFVQRSSNG